MPADGEAAGQRLLHRTRASLVVGMSLANIIGALVVVVLAVVIVPEPKLRHQDTVIVENIIVTAIYVAVAVAVGNVVGFRILSGLGEWLPVAREPSPEEASQVLLGPFRLALTMGGLWALATVLFGVINTVNEPALGVRVIIVVAFGGLATVNVAYLFAERFLRPVAALALRSRRAELPGRVQSVAARQIVTWALGTGGPVLGLVAIGLAAVAGVANMNEHLGRTMLVLGGTALIVGLLATLVAARATADPIASVREGVDRVAAGDFGVEVPVYDGTAIGLLQAGFNRMVVGLGERDRLADLFGRHVGVEVARQALERGIDLGGETRDVAVLFVDLVGSTTLATELAPSEVVHLLNRFFSVVVTVVEEEAGFINKFEGDAALAIFGAPADSPGRHGDALRAARRMAERFRAELAEVDFGIGVASGDAVAGNIGSQHRLEYTVIGDPVNEASRLTDLAKRLPGRVAASGVVVDAADEEGEGWETETEEVLRGRSAPTRVCVPASVAT